MKDTCSDGQQHKWHFFKREGHSFRQCLKCSLRQFVTLENSRFWVWRRG